MPLGELKLRKIVNFELLKRCFKFKECAKIETINDIKLENVDPNKPFAIDFRWADFSDLERFDFGNQTDILHNMSEILKNADFSTFAIFPSDNFMPEGFKKSDRETC